MSRLARAGGLLVAAALGFGSGMVAYGKLIAPREAEAQREEYERARRRRVADTRRVSVPRAGSAPARVSVASMGSRGAVSHMHRTGIDETNTSTS